MPPRLLPNLLLACSLLINTGCTSGRLSSKMATTEANPAQPPGEIDPSRLLQCVQGILKADSPNRSNSLFIHPGLLLSNLDWDRSLAMEAGDFLHKKAYTGRVIEVRDRSAAPVRDHMLQDPGTQFVGIHYSMGGNPHYLRASIEATHQAATARGLPLRYHAIMIDPSGIGEIENVLDIDAPEIGYIFVILSAERSMLRPGISGFSQKLLDSGKVYVMHAEDFGEDWNHFGMLEALRSSIQANETDASKVGALLEYLVTVALASEEKLVRLPGHCGDTNHRIASGK